MRAESCDDTQILTQEKKEEGAKDPEPESLPEPEVDIAIDSPLCMGDFLSKIRKENNKLGFKWMDAQAVSSQESEASIIVEDDGEGDDIFNKDLEIEEEEEKVPYAEFSQDAAAIPCEELQAPLADLVMEN